jgi:hypothetical protein
MGGNKAAFAGKGAQLSLDAPLPTVMGGDTLGLAPFQFQLRTKNGARSAGEPAPTVLSHNRAHTHGEMTIVEPEADMRRYATGREWAKLEPGGQSDRYFQLVRAAPGKPSPAITVEGMKAHAASVAHPTECRKFSIAELRRICAFPDDFVLTGTYAQQWERLGRAVPPLMMKALAETIRDQILERAAKKRPGRSRVASKGVRSVERLDGLELSL